MSSGSSIDEVTLDAVHEALTAVYVQLGSRTFDELALELRAILQRYEAEYRAAPSAWLELRRRVAETTLTVAIGKNRPVAECGRLLADIRDLGFSDLHRRAQMETMYCGYCMRRGDTESVSLLLGPLAQALRAKADRTGEDVWHKHLLACEAMLARL